MFFSGLNMIGIGVLGEYVGRIFDEVKNRPMYLVDHEYGFDSDALIEGRRVGVEFASTETGSAKPESAETDSPRLDTRAG